MSRGRPLERRRCGAAPPPGHRRAAGLAPGQSRAATIMLMRVNRRRLGKQVAGKYDTESP